MEAKDKIIVAVDVDDLRKAKKLINDLAPYVGCFKIGLELISSVGGPQAVNFVHNLRGEVFYDGKFDDIPNTVGRAAKAISELGVKMFNLHASASVEAMMEAVKNRAEAPRTIKEHDEEVLNIHVWRKPLVLAVTVLTALEENNAHLIFGAPIKAKVLQFARDAKIAGCDGIICSPQELEFLGKHSELNDLLRVVPGIRPKWSVKDDQKRITTPADAIKAGADYLVIGRPITDPSKEVGSPIDAVKSIIDEIESVL